jgi:hypothetical protein
MTGEQVLLFLMGPIGGLLIAGVLFYITRREREPRTPQAGE